MLADEFGLRNLLNINVVYARKLAQSITCLSRPTFETALEQISPAALDLMAQFRHLRKPPQIAVVEVSVELRADADAFIAWGETEANVKVTLTWRRDS